MSQAQTLPTYSSTVAPLSAESFIPGLEEEEEVVVEFTDILDEFEESTP